MPRCSWSEGSPLVCGTARSWCCLRDNPASASLCHVKSSHQVPRGIHDLVQWAGSPHCLLIRLKAGSAGKTMWSAWVNVGQEARTCGSQRGAINPLLSWAQLHFGSSESTQPVDRSHCRPVRAGSWLRGSVFPLQRVYFAGPKQYNQPSNLGAQGWVPKTAIWALGDTAWWNMEFSTDLESVQAPHGKRYTCTHAVSVPAWASSETLKKPVGCTPGWF